MRTRIYNRFERKEFGVIVKKSKTDRLRDEMSYYLSIPETLQPLFPRVFSCNFAREQDEYNELSMEFYPYHNLGQYLLEDNITSISWLEVMRTLAQVLEKFRNVSSVSRPEYAATMYINKTESEYGKFVDHFNDNLFSHPTLIINGGRYANFEALWPRVKQYINDELLEYDSTMIHGDFCFSNILYDPLIGPRFIDMRGSFGLKGIFGDQRYDIAKLAHSIDGGYEYFIYDNFSVCRTDDNEYTLDLLSNPSRLESARFAFEKYIMPSFDKKQIKIIQGTIFIGMCDRHNDSVDRQRAMYLTGIKLLNEGMIL